MIAQLTAILVAVVLFAVAGFMTVLDAATMARNAASNAAVVANPATGDVIWGCRYAWRGGAIYRYGVLCDRIERIFDGKEWVSL